jgi:hypothetical protein
MLNYYVTWTGEAGNTPLPDSLHTTKEYYDKITFFGKS